MRQKKWDKLTINDYIELKRRLTVYVLNKQKHFARLKGKLPTFKDVCKRFSLTLDQVEQLCDDTDDCCVNTALRAGNMIGCLDRADYIVEILI